MGGPSCQSAIQGHDLVCSPLKVLRRGGQCAEPPGGEQTAIKPTRGAEVGVDARQQRPDRGMRSGGGGAGARSWRGKPDYLCVQEEMLPAQSHHFLSIDHFQGAFPATVVSAQKATHRANELPISTAPAFTARGFQRRYGLNCLLGFARKDLCLMAGLRGGIGADAPLSWIV